MPDSVVFITDDVELSEFTITVASECYSDLDLVQDALIQQPDFNSAIVWGTPCTPDPEKVTCDAELVLLVTDRASLQLAIDRLSTYRQLNQTAILIYLRDDEDVSAEEIPGLTLHRLQLTAGLSYLTRALFAPIIPQGLICVDWADTRNLLVMNGQIVMEEASGSQREAVIEAVVTRLRKRASGRSIPGLQVSILCSQNKLAVRHVHHLLSMCKETAGEESTFIVAAPFLDWPDSDYYEVRLFARVECAGPEGID